ncbi:Transcriptional regulator, TetR family [Labilithrix luteola]|uniref:Transcriptional regulator, TetR family n=1 Tax=Labilithrix luteola TaxID=1391654 RepID=A0A0K1QDH7_9BACT|nr:TetR/AcrR family transcriptional regulator C-terminal domain-containing protein [Labilithrix luteola]AKV03490.1 Transcriptional regulator, TetR family [Labilithrix luteola]
MPRPRSLTLDAIAAAALELVDREGLPALSMRAVASELGVGAMSLYRYVEDRGQLEALMVERVLGAIDVSIPRAASGWRASVVVLVDRARDAIADHPAIVPLLLAHRHTSKSSRSWGEAVLGVLHDAGFSVDARVIGFRSLLSYVLGAVQVEHFGSLGGEGTAALAEPSEEFPRLAETARQARKISVEREFHQGLAVVLDGLERLRASQGPTKAKRD